MIQETVSLLGLWANDKITGFGGIIASVNFDLYGCAQAVLTPPTNEKGEVQTHHIFDLGRLDLDYERRIMPVPDFDGAANLLAPKPPLGPANPETPLHSPEGYRRGPAEKPTALLERL